MRDFYGQKGRETSKLNYGEKKKKDMLLRRYFPLGMAGIHQAA